jgi:1-acyl-sn-glycerol-3-phosphate acyltransferase
LRFSSTVWEHPSVKWLSYQVLRALGWRFEGVIPDMPKMVIVGAPHTSNWDFLLFLAALHHFDVKVRFLGKHTLFRRPFGFFFRRWGGIPVDRRRAAGVVGQVKEAFEATTEMILVITPEGTRSAVPAWKSGFLEIAERVGVPVVPAGVDGTNKVVAIGAPLPVGLTRDESMDRLRGFFATRRGIRPRNAGPVRLSEETAAS